MDKEDDGYIVGPGRPPTKYQFKKGQSGNPLGRPKGSLNLKTVLLEELSAEVGLKNGASIPAIQAIARRLVRLAVEGDLRAIESVFARAERYQVSEQDEQTDLPEEDFAILNRMRCGSGSALGGSTGQSADNKNDEDNDA